MGDGCSCTECGYVRAATIRVESPPVVRALETTVDNATVTQSGIAMRTAVGKRTETRCIAHDDHALAQKLDPRRGTDREFVRATDGQPTAPQTRRGVGERIR